MNSVKFGVKVKPLVVVCNLADLLSQPEIQNIIIKCCDNVKVMCRTGENIITEYDGGVEKTVVTGLLRFLSNHIPGHFQGQW